MKVLVFPVRSKSEANSTGVCFDLQFANIGFIMFAHSAASRLCPQRAKVQSPAPLVSCNSEAVPRTLWNSIFICKWRYHSSYLVMTKIIRGKHLASRVLSPRCSKMYVRLWLHKTEVKQKKKYLVFTCLHKTKNRRLTDHPSFPEGHDAPTSFCSQVSYW